MRNVILLAIGMFALGLDAYVVAGLVPGISETYQKSASQVGQAVSIFTLFYAISAPLFASILSGKSIKKVLLVSMFIFGVANAISAVAPNFFIFLISRAIAGVGAGLFSPLAVAGSTLLVPENKKGRALSVTIGGMSMGTVLGVPVGLYIATVLNWQAVMWVIAVLSCIAFVTIYKMLPKIPVTAPPTMKERLAMFVDKKVAVTVSITFFASIASLGLYTYISPFLEEFNAAQDVTIYLWTWGLGGLFGSFIIGYVIDYFKKLKIITLSILIILTVAVACIPLAIYIPIIQYMPFFVWGAMGWAAQAPQQQILMEYEPNQGSAAVALNSSVNYLGSSVGAMLGGVVLSLGKGSMLLIYFAILAMLVSLVLQLYSMRSSFVVSKTSGIQK
ncbi:MFS transporter [Bacillus manliponensis]|uniref:MFS transporter n=1 Tax=Bacillus manliponensis TaxID=574376 RepID=UPI0035173D98